MFCVLSRARDKEKILSSYKEWNLKPSNSALRCCTTEPRRLSGERRPLWSSYVTRVLHTSRISDVDSAMSINIYSYPAQNNVSGETGWEAVAKILGSQLSFLLQSNMFWYYINSNSKSNLKYFRPQLQLHLLLTKSYALTFSFDYFYQRWKITPHLCSMRDKSFPASFSAT